MTSKVILSSIRSYGKKLDASSLCNMQAAKIFNATEVDPNAVEAILEDLVMATTPSATNPISQFPRDLDTTNNVVDMAVNYLRTGLESGEPTDLSTVSVELLVLIVALRQIFYSKWLT